jgi:hypothetical protein
MKETVSYFYCSVSKVMVERSFLISNASRLIQNCVADNHIAAKCRLGWPKLTICGAWLMCSTGSERYCLEAPFNIGTKQIKKVFLCHQDLLIWTN